VRERLLLRALGVDEAEIYGLDGGLGTVGDPEFGDQALETFLDGGEAEVQLLGDLAVGLARGQQPKHLELTRRERLGERFRVVLEGPDPPMGLPRRPGAGPVA
jgi:hypothetical protein